MDNGLINIICIAYPTSLQSFDLNRGSTQKKEIQKNKSQNRNEKCCNYRPCPWDL